MPSHITRLALMASLALALPVAAFAAEKPDANAPKTGRTEKAAKAVDAAGQAAGKAAEAAADAFYSLPLANQAADQRAARAALARRESLPLDEILRKVAAAHPGDVVDVDFEREGGRWIYEVKLIETAGTVLEVEVDAATGAILRSKRDRF